MDFSRAKEYIVNRLIKELSKDLYYHGAHHTFDVVKAARLIGNKEGVSNEDMLLLSIAAYFHDAGFLVKYHNNEVDAVAIVKEVLPDMGFSEDEIKTIEGIIMATHPEIEPETLLQKVMCDADHDYLGRNDYKKVSDNLRKELAVYEVAFEDEKWLEKQINYLRNKHRFYTETSIELRLENKMNHIKRMEELLNSEN